LSENLDAYSQHFDGFRIGPNNQLRLFLRTHGGSSFALALHGVDDLTLTEIKYGNIVFDLVLRSGLQLITSDIEELFGIKPDTPQATDVLKVKSDAGLQLLEINSSYGAHGLVLFQSMEIHPSSPSD
jgi:hypothetical protein